MSELSTGTKPSKYGDYEMVNGAIANELERENQQLKTELKTANEGLTVAYQCGFEKGKDSLVIENKQLKANWAELREYANRINSLQIWLKMKTIEERV